jgi:hypothetical protein
MKLKKKKLYFYYLHIAFTAPHFANKGCNGEWVDKILNPSETAAYKTITYYLLLTMDTYEKQQLSIIIYTYRLTLTSSLLLWLR